MYKNISKRIFIILICGWLAFSSSYIVYEKSYCYAMEWAGVTIGLDTAFKFLLGLLGVSCGIGVAEEIDWAQTREDCMAFQQNQGQSAVAVSEWWSNVCDGALDKSSDCWDSFKEYVNTLVNTSSDVVLPTCKASALITSYLNQLGLTSRYTVDIDNDFDCVAFVGGCSSSAMNLRCFFVTSYDTSGVLCSYGGRGFCVAPINATTVSSSNALAYSCYYIQVNSGGVINDNSFYNYNEFIPDVSGNWVDTGSADRGFIDWNIPKSLNINAYPHAILDNSITDLTGVSVEVPTESNFEGITNNVEDLTIVNKGDIVIDGDAVINLPWDNVGDDSLAIDDVIQGLIDKVNDGTLSLDNYCENIQNITNTYVYETTNNYIFPNGEEDNEKIDDKINENKSNEGFTLFGLEKFFPFCIPWDIYAFISILEADAVAPQIPVPIPNISTKQIDTYTIDLSPLEPVAVVMRYGFDFIFIIGLALLSRSLIGAGGSE